MEESYTSIGSFLDGDSIPTYGSIGFVYAAAVVFILLLVAIGALYQEIATQADRRKYPPPGKLVDVGSLLKK